MTAGTRTTRWRDVLTAVALAALGYYLYLVRDDLAAGFSQLDARSFLLILATIYAQWAMRTTRDRYLLSAHGYDVPWRGLFMINNTQLAMNHLPMRAGTVVAAAILKRQHDVRLKDFASFFAAQQVLVLLPASIIAGVVLFLHDDANPALRETGLLAVAVIVAGFVSALTAPIAKLTFIPSKIRELVDKVQTAVRSTLKDPRLSVPLLGLSFGMFVASATRIFVIFRDVLGVDTDPGAALLVTTTIHLSLLVSITPAGLGIREAFVGIGAGLMSIAPATGVIASVVERAVVIFAMVAVFLIAWLARPGLDRGNG